MYEFYEIAQREQVIKLVQEYFDTNLNEQPFKTSREGFNIRVVTLDDGTLVDYCVFDPHRNCFDGYLDPSGWSHWQEDAYRYLPDELREEWDNLIV